MDDDLKSSTTKSSKNNSIFEDGRQPKFLFEIGKQLQKTPITLVYSYSSITLTESMKKLLNRGLNFCVK